MSWYATGTISLTNGSTAVTGSGTQWITGAQVGEAMLIAGELYEISAINSATSITLGKNYLGSTQSGLSYEIIPTQSLVADLASDVTDLISDYATIANNAGAGKFNDGTETSPGITFNQDQDNGFYRSGSNTWVATVGGADTVEFNSTGIDVTGILSSDGLSVSGTTNDTLATLDGAGTNFSLQITSGDTSTQNTSAYRLALDYLNTYTNGFIDFFRGSAGNDGYLELGASGSKVMKLDSSGIDVTGTVTADGLTVEAGSSRHIVAGLDTRGDGRGSLKCIEPSGNNLRNLDIEGETVQISTNSFSNSTSTRRALFDDNGDISFYEDTGTTAKFFWDASEEKLNLSGAGGLDVTGTVTADGLTVDNNNATVQSSTATALNLVGGDGNSKNVVFKNSSHVQQAKISNLGADGLAFFSGSTQAATIDSSANFLVGKTSSSINTAGGEFQADGLLVATRDGGNTAVFNRKSSDGDLCQFRKDNTTVGSVSISGSQLRIDAESNNLVLIANAGNSEIITQGTFRPLVDNSDDLGSGTRRFKDLYLSGGINNGTNSIAFNGGAFAGNGSGNDANIDLGRTNRRFKDLYLSGGVHLGGTGSAHKLDDYEEGSWTPAFNLVSNTVTSSLGSYTKVGNLVTATAYLDVSSIDNTDTSGVQVTLPFTASTSQQYKMGLVTIDTSISTVLTGSGQSSVLGAYVSGSVVVLTKASSAVTYSSGCNTSGVLALTVQYRAS